MNDPSPLAPAPSPDIDRLNDAQRAAVLELDGPVLVLAGAGTGKTRVLTTRLAHLLRTGRAYPSQILSVTFTNKAAQEMKTRVAELTGGPVEGWWLGTFHSLAARMLRPHAEKVGLTGSYTIIDDDDQIRLLKQIAESENIDTKKCPPRLLQTVIARWKDKGLNPSDIGMHDAGDIANGKMPHIYRLYQDRLKTVNACDFGDLLLHMITILRDPKYVDVLNDYHRKFKYLMVDEYQDTNTAQYLWLRLLAAGTHNICCVGDDDQSIYGWRGAEISNILRFEQDFPNAKVIRLEQNYRSTGHILAAASGVIAHNNGRLGKTLWSDRDMGEPVRVRGIWNGEEEAPIISDIIETLKSNGENLSTMAILVRAGFQMRAFEDRFSLIGLPFRIFGGPRFYERKEIRDALAYFRVVVQPNDDLALEKIINKPKRGLGEKTIADIHTYARPRNLSLYNAIGEMLSTTNLKPKVRESLRMVVSQFDRWRNQLNSLPHGELAGIILDESGYTAMLQADKDPDAPGRLENLKELVGRISEKESLPDFLEYVALVMDNAPQNGDDFVSIMTLHAAKGLEFDTIILPGWEEGIFPSQRALDENGLAGLEEERRLAYVGITRAKRRTIITCAGSRLQYGSWVQNLPSRFIGEIPADHVILQGDQGMAVVRPSEWAQAGEADVMPDPNRWSRGASTLPAPSRTAVRDDPNIPHVGARVMHDTFGMGTVIHAVGQKLDIRFDDGENRRVMAGFVEVM